MAKDKPPPSPKGPKNPAGQAGVRPGRSSKQPPAKPPSGGKK